MAERKLAVMAAAADRWQEKLPALSVAAEKLKQGGPAAASSAEARDRFIAREATKRIIGRGPVMVERIIGTDDLEQDPPTDAARLAGRPVARIVELLTDRRVGEGFATGFVVAPGLVMTNWHVFARREEARDCGAQFGFERNAAGLLEPGVVFELDPDSFFFSDERLDIALVAVRRNAIAGNGAFAAFGAVKLIPSRGKILVGQPVSIIQHPDGRHKHWGVRDNKLVIEPADADLFLTYTTDTLGGSSGSPAFNRDWELVGVHHSGVPRRVNGLIVTRSGQPWREGMSDSEIDWIANEGVRISKVVAGLRSVHLPNASEQAQLDALLAEANDPVFETVAPSAGTERLPSTTTSTIGGGAMNITVNGTANFYLSNPQAERTELLQAGAAAAPHVEASIEEKKLRFDPDYAHRPGYDAGFLAGFQVPHPTAPANEALLDENDEPLVLAYHHYSLVMHKARRLAMWTASNVDYDAAKRRKSRKDFGTDTWKPDPRIPITAQIEDVEFYEPAAKFDRGHLVRRDDVAWGKSAKEEEFGNADSFHWTNCTPQHEGFNRDMFEYHGLWGQLENHITQQAGFVGNTLTLFAGPVLDDNDESRDFGSGIAVQVPKVFWKVVVAVENVGAGDRLRAYGFFLDQTAAIDEYGWEGRFRVGRFDEQQVPLREISERTRVVFDPSLHEADPLANVAVESRRRTLRTLADIKLR